MQFVSYSLVVTKRHRLKLYNYYFIPNIYFSYFAFLNVYVKCRINTKVIFAHKIFIDKFYISKSFSSKSFDNVCRLFMHMFRNIFPPNIINFGERNYLFTSLQQLYIYYLLPSTSLTQPHTSYLSTGVQ